MWRLVLLLIVLCGCNDRRTAATAVNTDRLTNASPLITDPPTHLDHAQPKLRTMKLWLGPREITAELAVSRVEIGTGMMFRESMEENEGMLFIFAQPVHVAFYMKNTRIPLSCAYMDSDGTILEIHDMTPLDLTPIEARGDRVQYVLEVKQGWFERNNIKIGTVVRTEHGSFAESFFRRRGNELQ